MKKLKESFTKNGTYYQLVKRTAAVAMFSQFCDNVLIAYEVFVIPIRDDKYGLREGFPSNEEMGKSFSSRSFGGKQKKEQAENWYAELAGRAERPNKGIELVRGLTNLV